MDDQQKNGTDIETEAAAIDRQIQAIMEGQGTGDEKKRRPSAAGRIPFFRSWKTYSRRKKIAAAAVLLLFIFCSLMLVINYESYLV